MKNMTAHIDINEVRALLQEYNEELLLAYISDKSKKDEIYIKQCALEEMVDKFNSFLESKNIKG